MDTFNFVTGYIGGLLIVLSFMAALHAPQSVFFIAGGGWALLWHGIAYQRQTPPADPYSEGE